VEDLKLYEQFLDLSLSFPNLRLQKDVKGPWYVSGVLKFSREYLGHPIDDEYSVKIIVSEHYPDVLPKIFETGKRIPKDFHHYQDESLCLGAPLAVKQKFSRQPTLLGFVDNCVIPYLYSFSYQSRFGKMPFGELSHGGIGILEYYQDLFGVNDRRRVLKLLQILADDNYRGHDRCPCGSGKRIRSCHGKLLLKLQKLQSPEEFHAEQNLILKHLIHLAMQKPALPYN